MSERLEDPHSTYYLEPPLAGDGLSHDWRLVTNFMRPAEIARAFGVWPDDVLSSRALQALYERKSGERIRGFTVKANAETLPLFPFLDEAEGTAIQRLIERRKEPLYRPFRAGLESLTTLGHGLTDAVPVILQPLLVLTLRKLEKEMGLWGKRSPVQKRGAAFALRPDSQVPFVRVSSFPGRLDDRVALPWGGPYREYGKMLQLVESRYSRLVFASALEDLEVVPDGHVIKKMQYAGLVRNHDRGFLGSRWVLTLPVVRYTAVKDSIPILVQVVQGISGAFAEALAEMPGLMRSGRYSYLEGHGDYLEMAYSVLFGLLCGWAMEDGMLARPPSFKVTDQGAFVERSVAQRLRGEYPSLPGMVILKDARAVWEWIVSHGQDA